MKIDPSTHPFIDLLEIDEIAILGPYRIACFATTIQGHHAVVASCPRSRDERDRNDLLAHGTQLWQKLDPEGTAMLREKADRRRLARVEERILARLALIRAGSAFRDRYGKDGLPFESIGHSVDRVVVLVSDEHCGVDHEVIYHRGEGWLAKVDPAGDAKVLASLIQSVRVAPGVEVETALWSVKEASMKAWDLGDLGVLPSIRLAWSGNHLITTLPGKNRTTRNCTNYVYADATSVLAIAFRCD